MDHQNSFTKLTHSYNRSHKIGVQVLLQCPQNSLDVVSFERIDEIFSLDFVIKKVIYPANQFGCLIGLNPVFTFAVSVQKNKK